MGRHSINMALLAELWSTATNIPGPEPRRVCDQLQAVIDLAIESLAQPRFPLIEIFNLRCELHIRLGVQFDSHDRKRASIFAFTSSRGTPLTFPD